MALDTVAARTKRRKLPNVDAPRVSDDELRRSLEAIREHLRMYEGDSGAPKERFVTIKELELAGVIGTKVQGNFALIDEVLGNAVSQGQQTGAAGGTTIIEGDTIINEGGGATTLAALTDTNVAGAASNSFLQLKNGFWSGTNIYGTTATWTARQDFQGCMRIRGVDSGYVEFCHDNTDMNVTGSATTDVNLIGLNVNFELGQGIEWSDVRFIEQSGVAGQPLDYFIFSEDTAMTTTSGTFVDIPTTPPLNLGPADLTDGEEYFIFYHAIGNSSSSAASTGLQLFYGSAISNSRWEQEGLNGGAGGLSYGSWCNYCTTFTANATDTLKLQWAALGGGVMTLGGIWGMVLATSQLPSFVSSVSSASLNINTGTSNSYNDTGQELTLDAGDWIVFVNQKRNLGAVDQRVALQWGGTDYEIDSRYGTDSQDNGTQLGGFIMIPNFAGGTVKARFYRLTTQAQLIDRTAMYAFKLSDLGEYYVSQTLDNTEILPTAQNTFDLVASVTAPSIGAGDYLVLARGQPDNNTTDFQASHRVFTNVDAGGSTNVDLWAAVNGILHRGDSPTVVSTSGYHSASAVQTYTEGQSVVFENKMRSGGAGWAGLGSMNAGIVAIKLSTADNSGFFVGDPAYSTQIDGTQINILSQVGVNWADGGGAFVELLNLAPGTSLYDDLPDINTLSFDHGSTVPLLDDTQYGLWVAPDGTFVVTGNFLINRLEKYPLSTAWDLTTMGAVSQASTTWGGSLARYPTGVWISDDGLKVFWTEFDNDRICEEAITTPYDLTEVTGTPDATLADVTTATGDEALGLWFNAAGTRMAVGGDSGTVHLFSLSTAWDLTTATRTGDKTVGPTPSSVSDVTINEAGTKMWVTARSGVGIYQWSMATPWDIANATYDTLSYNINNVTAAQGTFVEPTLGYLFVVAGGPSADTYLVERHSFTPTGNITYSGKTFFVGDPLTDTQIDGPTTTITGNAVVNGTTQLDSTLSVAGITSLNNDVVGATTLDAATGDEVAWQLDYTTNKATSGADTGFQMSMTDTLSPGTSLFASYRLGTTPLFTWGIDGTYSIFDTTGADSAVFAHGGTDFDTTFSNTTDWNIIGLTGSVNFQDGAELRLWNDTDTEYLRAFTTGTGSTFDWATGGLATAQFLGASYWAFNRQANAGSELRVGESTVTRGGSQTAKVILYGEYISSIYSAEFENSANAFRISGGTVNPVASIELELPTNVTGNFGVTGTTATFDVQSIVFAPPATSGYLFFDKALSTDNVGIMFRDEAAINRWLIRGTSGAADDFVLSRYDATGVFQDNPIFVAAATGDVTLSGNLALGGTVDGRDVAADGTAQDNHIADSTIHFTQGAISIPLSQINDVTATAAEVNLLDLAGLTAGWALIADSATTASWQALPPGVPNGTAEGNTLYWDNTGGSWTENDAVVWDETNQRLKIGQMYIDDIGTSSFEILNSSLGKIFTYTAGVFIVQNSEFRLAAGNVLDIHGTGGARARIRTDTDDFLFFTEDVACAGAKFDYFTYHQDGTVAGTRPTGYIGLETMYGAMHTRAAVGGLPTEYFAPIANVNSRVWRFNNPTTAADPGSQFMRANTTDLSTITEFYFDDLDITQQDAGIWFTRIAVGDILFISQLTSYETHWGYYEVTSKTDNTGWWTVGVSHIAAGDSGASSVYSNGQAVYIDHIPQTRMTGLGATPQTVSTLWAADLNGNIQAQNGGFFTVASDGIFRLQERTTGPTAAAGYGYLWVKDDVAQKLYFRDDTGTDFELNAAAGLGGSIADNQVAYGNGTDIAGSANLTWDDTNLDITGGISVTGDAVFSKLPSGSGANASTLTVINNQPRIGIIDDNASANNQRWGITNLNGGLQIQAFTDTWTSGNPIISASRSAQVPTIVTCYASTRWEWFGPTTLVQRDRGPLHFYPSGDNGAIEFSWDGSDVDFGITSTGTNLAADLNIAGFTGDFVMGNYRFDMNQSLTGADNYVLTYDSVGGKISLEAATGGGGTIGGSIADNQVAVGNGSNAIDGSANLTFNGTRLVGTQAEFGTAAPTNARTFNVVSGDTVVATFERTAADGTLIDIETPTSTTNASGIRWLENAGSVGFVGYDWALEAIKISTTYTSTAWMSIGSAGNLSVFGEVQAGGDTNTRGVLRAYSDNLTSPLNDEGLAPGLLWLEGRAAFNDWNIQPYENTLRFWAANTTVTSPDMTLSTAGNLDVASIDVTTIDATGIILQGTDSASTVHLQMDANSGGFVIEPGTTVGGWARGHVAKKQSDATVMAGAGFLGSNESVSSWHVGFGASWWATDDVFRITPTVVEAIVNLDALAGIDITGGDLTGGSNNANTFASYRTTAANGNGIGFWNGPPSTYGIYMSTGGDVTYGGRADGETTSDYNMYFEMNSGTNRGFVFETDGSVLMGIHPNGVYIDDSLYVGGDTADVAEVVVSGGEGFLSRVVASEGIAGSFGGSLTYDGGGNVISLRRHDNSTDGTVVLSFPRTGNDVTFAGGIYLQDNQRLYLGTSGAEGDIYSNGTDIYLDLNAGVDFRLRGGSANDNMIIANADGSIVLYYDNSLALVTQPISTAGNTSTAQVYDSASNAHDIGFNTLPNFNFNASDTLESGHCGHITGKDNTTTTYVLTGPTSSDVDFPVGGVCQVVNLGATGNYTLNDTATCTMYWMDGTAAPVDIAGAGTLEPGGWITLWRYSTTAIYITGNGFTP